MSLWPLYAFPLAQLPPRPHRDGHVDHPVIVRLVQDPGLRGVIEKISRRHGNLPHFMRLGVVVFGYCPNPGEDPISMIILRSDTEPDGSIEWIVSSMAPSPGMEHLHVKPATLEHVADAWAERNSWLWFLFDVLGVVPKTMNNAAQANLVTPQLLSDNQWDAMLQSPATIRLKQYQQLLSEEDLRLHQMEDALTYGEGSEAWETFVHLYGDPPTLEETHTLSSRLVELRKDGLRASANVLGQWALATSKREDFTTPYPFLQTTFNFPFNDWVVTGESLDDHFQWSVHRSGEAEVTRLTPQMSVMPVFPYAASGSTEGPMQALAQAGLFLPDRAFDDWLDSSMVEGHLLYDDEAYRLLGSNPAFYDEADFKVWARSLELVS